jgi:hypothetical protein
MKPTLKLLSLAFLATTAASITACKSGPSEPNYTENSAVIESKNGAMVVDTKLLVATIKAIDTTSRQLTLTTSNGYKTKVTCGPSVVNFPQLKVGDEVNIKATEEFAVYLSPVGTPTSDGAGAAVALAPRGEMPGGFIAGTEQVTARVIALDVPSRSVTLQFMDGMTKVLKVGQDVDLARVSLGQDVTVQVAESLAITVTQP